MPSKDVKSRYTVLITNVSGGTPKKDVIRELERAGPLLACAKDDHDRMAIAEFKHASDADYAYRKVHGIRMDGRRWEVRYATKNDFKDFGWKWTEGGDESDEEQHTAYNSSYGGARERSRSPAPYKRKESYGSPQRSDY